MQLLYINLNQVTYTTGSAKKEQFDQSFSVNIPRHQLKIEKPHSLQNNNNENIKTNMRLRDLQPRF